MGQIKNIKLHIVTDIKNQRKLERVEEIVTWDGEKEIKQICSN